MRNSAPLALYSRNMSRALWRSYGGGLVLLSEVTLYSPGSNQGASSLVLDALVQYRLHLVRNGLCNKDTPLEERNGRGKRKLEGKRWKTGEKAEGGLDRARTREIQTATD